MKKFLKNFIYALGILGMLSWTFYPYQVKADITSNLVAWWKWDEGTGSSASDSTGNGHTGTLIGTASWTSSSKIGPFASIYTGVSGNGTGLSAFSTGTTWTYATWFWVDSGAQSTYVNFIGAGGTTDLGVKTNVNHVSYFASGADHLGTATIGRDGWHHMAVVNNAGTITLYYDGVADALSAGSSASGVSFNANGMGCDSGSGSECLKGRLDDGRLYSRALSASDIAELYAYTGIAYNGQNMMMSMGF